MRRMGDFTGNQVSHPTGLVGESQGQVRRRFSPLAFVVYKFSYARSPISLVESLCGNFNLS